jgi:hypothetical protein
MKAEQISVFWRRFAAIAVVMLSAGCALIEGPEPANPLLGTWTNTENDRVTLQPNAVIVSPNKGQSAPMGAADCNGVFTLVYGRMATAPFAVLFPAQPDLEAKLKAALVQPEYPVAEVTCGQGGTTYFMVGDSEVVAIYRDAGVGGLEHLTRL